MVGRVEGLAGPGGYAVVPLHAPASGQARVEPVEPAAPAHMRFGRVDRSTEFLTQLIGMRDGFPQARARRRAAPADAIRAYRETRGRIAQGASVLDRTV